MKYAVRRVGYDKNFWNKSYNEWVEKTYASFFASREEAVEFIRHWRKQCPLAELKLIRIVSKRDKQIKSLEWWEEFAMRTSGLPIVGTSLMGRRFTVK